MRTLLLKIGILSSLAVAPVSQAANGTVDINWDSCTGPVDKTTAVGAPYELFISEIGLDQVHIAYEVRFVYGNESQAVPDAWRFDADGCEGGLLIINALSKSCPPFAQTANGSAIRITRIDFSQPYEPYPTTVLSVI